MVEWGREIKVMARPIHLAVTTHLSFLPNIPPSLEGASEPGQGFPLTV